MKLLLYCTKSKPYLIGRKYAPYKYYLDKGGKYSVMDSRDHIHNGKVVAECDFEVEEITPSNLVDFEIESCVDRVSMLKYFKPNLIWDNKFETLLNTFGNSTLGYAIRIKNLHIYNKPRPNKWFGYTDKKGYLCMVEKAPQNMMYCYDEFGNDYVLISIHSEWLCKILNGEKTIEVRKKVLKRMLENEH